MYFMLMKDQMTIFRIDVKYFSSLKIKERFLQLYFVQSILTDVRFFKWWLTKTRPCCSEISGKTFTILYKLFWSEQFVFLNTSFICRKLQLVFWFSSFLKSKTIKINIWLDTICQIKKELRSSLFYDWIRYLCQDFAISLYIRTYNWTISKKKQTCILLPLSYFSYHKQDVIQLYSIGVKYWKFFYFLD